jgi:hypothetical protein
VFLGSRAARRPPRRRSRCGSDLLAELLAASVGPRRDLAALGGEDCADRLDGEAVADQRRWNRRSAGAGVELPASTWRLVAVSRSSGAAACSLRSAGPAPLDLARTPSRTPSSTSAWTTHPTQAVAADAQLRPDGVRSPGHRAVGRQMVTNHAHRTGLDVLVVLLGTKPSSIARRQQRTRDASTPVRRRRSAQGRRRSLERGGGGAVGARSMCVA